MFTCMLYLHYDEYWTELRSWLQLVYYIINLDINQLGNITMLKFYLNLLSANRSFRKCVTDQVVQHQLPLKSVVSDKQAVKVRFS